MAHAFIQAQMEGGKPISIVLENVSFDESRKAASRRIGETIIDALYEASEEK